MSKKLTKQEWEQLDVILTKLGFGSFYDCVEVLKQMIANLNPTIYKIVEKEKETNLHVLIMLIAKLIIIKKKEES